MRWSYREKVAKGHRGNGVEGCRGAQSTRTEGSPAAPCYLEPPATAHVPSPLWLWGCGRSTGTAPGEDLNPRGVQPFQGSQGGRPPKELWAMSRVHWRQQHKAQKENGLVSGL